MAQNELSFCDDMRGPFLDADKAPILAGDNKFSIGTSGTDAGVERAAFGAHLSDKTALMAALAPEYATQSSAPIALAEQHASQLTDPNAIASQSAPQEIPKAEPEPSVPTPDAWLERRLRVFERALSALEAKAEATARDHARRIALLEEMLARLDSAPAERRRDPRPVVLAASQPAPMLEQQRISDVQTLGAETSLASVTPAIQETPTPENNPALQQLAIAPLPTATLSKEEMADVLQSARDKVRAAAAAKSEIPPPDSNHRLRWLAIGALSLVVLFLCIGLTLGNTLGASDGQLAQWQGSGVSHRHIAQGALARTIALADSGDARAQVRLAMAYLRGDGVSGDPQAALRWSKVAAEAGEPMAQYLLGALYQQGGPIEPDPTRAFAWFAAAAARGNLKAMHNLAIAYAEGQGTEKDAAKAAQWFERAAQRGYVDSAFDLAVLYERGDGVPQDPAQALKWYAIAARAGDAPSSERVQFLRGQMNQDATKLALDAAQEFTPLPALEEANSL